MARVLVFCDAYLPGYRAGGPVPSISRIIETDPSHEFRVVTRDREVDDSQSFPGMVPQTWLEVGNAHAAYLRPGVRDFQWLSTEVKAWQPDFYYLNSLHSPLYSSTPLLEMRLHRFPPAPLVLAPRGETSPGALALKRRKKQLAKPLIKRLVGESVTWHVSSNLEEVEVRNWWGGEMPNGHSFLVRPDLAVPPADQASSGGSPDEIPVVPFASRIDRMKGLDEAITLMASVPDPYRFEMRGVVRDAKYWESCRQAAAAELGDANYTFNGQYTPPEAQEIFARSVLLLLPTRGENFGHVIAEALSVGCPVLISNKTPWTPVVEDGGGAILHDRESARRFIHEVLTESAEARGHRRELALASYRRWFSANQDSSSLFGA